MLLSALTGIAVFCILSLCMYFKYMQISRNEFKKLSQVMHASQIQNQETTDLGFKAVQIQNNDCVAWLQIAETDIDYPVMQKPGQAEYYLRRNFEEEYSISGTPFLDELCDINKSSNIIIHGHNMKDGSMFAPLENYLDKRYGLEHPKFKLYLENEVREYNLMAVLHLELTLNNINQYYPQPQTQEEFDSFIKMLEQESLYCGGYSATWGEQLLTLSTCDNTTENGRILVVAKEL